MFSYSYAYSTWYTQLYQHNILIMYIYEYFVYDVFDLLLWQTVY